MTKIGGCGDRIWRIVRSVPEMARCVISAAAIRKRAAANLLNEKGEMKNGVKRNDAASIKRRRGEGDGISA